MCFLVVVAVAADTPVLEHIDHERLGYAIVTSGIRSWSRGSVFEALERGEADRLFDDFCRNTQHERTQRTIKHQRLKELHLPLSRSSPLAFPSLLQGCVDPLAQQPDVLLSIDVPLQEVGPGDQDVAAVKPAAAEAVAASPDGDCTSATNAESASPTAESVSADMLCALSQSLEAKTQAASVQPSQRSSTHSDGNAKRKRDVGAVKTATFVRSAEKSCSPAKKKRRKKSLPIPAAASEEEEDPSDSESPVDGTTTAAPAAASPATDAVIPMVDALEWPVEIIRRGLLSWQQHNDRAQKNSETDSQRAYREGVNERVVDAMWSLRDLVSDGPVLELPMFRPSRRNAARDAQSVFSQKQLPARCLQTSLEMLDLIASKQTTQQGGVVASEGTVAASTAMMEASDSEELETE